MFIQIKALPPADRPKGIHPGMEELYVSDKPHLNRNVFTLEDLIQSAGDDVIVIVTADHSQDLLEQSSHTCQVSCWGYDGLAHLIHMVPRAKPA
jgi:hypothetical protein